MDNEVSVVGRLTGEPELRFVGEGVPMTTFRILQTPRIKQGNAWVDGEPRGFDCTCWRGLAEKMALMPKGLLVRVGGEIVEDKWEDKQTGTPRSKHKIQAQWASIEIGALRDVEPEGQTALRIVYKGEPGERAHGSARPTQNPRPVQGSFSEEPF